MADAYDGFREFFAARRVALSRAAFFLAGSESDAEDLLQDALANTAARWPRLRDQNSEAYLRQVMLNAVRSRWRRRQKISEQPAGDIPERPTLGGPESDPVTKQLVSAALLRLTPRQRAVLAALLRGPVAGRGRTAARLLGRDGQEPDPRRARTAAPGGPRAGTRAVT